MKRHRLPVMLGVAFLLGALATEVRARPSVDDAVEALATAASLRLEEVRGVEAVYVAPLEGDAPAELMRARLQEALLRVGFRHFEREALPRALQEIEFQESGMVDPETARSFATRGVDAVLYGSVETTEAWWGASAIASLRMIGTGDGETLMVFRESHSVPVASPVALGVFGAGGLLLVLGVAVRILRGGRGARDLAATLRADQELRAAMKQDLRSVQESLGAARARAEGEEQAELVTELSRVGEEVERLEKALAAAAQGARRGRTDLEGAVQVLEFDRERRQEIDEGLAASRKLLEELESGRSPAAARATDLCQQMRSVRERFERREDLLSRG